MWTRRTREKERIGTSIVDRSDAHGHLAPMPSRFYKNEHDVDVAYARAIRAGGKSIEMPAEQPYGDRRAAVEDPYGNQWYVATHVKDVSHS